jgi:hypothetical protein
VAGDIPSIPLRVPSVAHGIIFTLCIYAGAVRKGAPSVFPRGFPRARPYARRPGRRYPYSSRNARDGSTLVARLAGSQHAATPTNTRNAGTATNVSASRYAGGSAVVALEPDVAGAFPSPGEADEALRALAGII